jgi:AmmeMemoRadiSam system protein B
MACIERQDAAAFSAYLEATRNTICGRHPIGVLLQAMRFSRQKFETKFTRYSQSGPIRDARRDTSVSYASATVVPLLG